VIDASVCGILRHDGTVQGLCFWWEGHTGASQYFYHKDASFWKKKQIPLSFDIAHVFYMVAFHPAQVLDLHGSNGVSRPTLFCWSLFAHNHLLRDEI